MEKGKGMIIPCLLDNKDNITHQQCRQYLTKMASIIFSDYRLINGFYAECKDDVDQFSCGSIDTVNVEYHNQGTTINCLQKKYKSLVKECQRQILRVAELSSNDYHQDRALYFACRNDRERFCETVTAGNGKIYKCLMKHKFEHDMSDSCKEKLTIRQRLTAEDYKVAYKLQKTCSADIKKYHCEFHHVKNKEAKLSFLLLCLENQIKKGNKVSGECKGEIYDKRKELMEDYMVNPDIVLGCKEEIEKTCHGLQRQGKTLHCLMGMARQGQLSPTCLNAVETLVKESDAGEDYRIDSSLQKACQPVVDTACKKIDAGDAAVLSCLMEHLYTPAMVPDCEKELLDLQYFVSRDFRLDPRLYQQCKDDATNLCHAPKDWISQDDDDVLGAGVIFACLHRYLHPTQGAQKLSRKCASEVHRVMRLRADNVNLHPRIEASCREVLGRYCSENVNKGEEMDCLQKHLEDLQGECKSLVANFTVEEAEDIKLDKMLMRACEPMLTKFCKDVVEQEQDEGNLMRCLIDNKNNGEMNLDCAAGIEHFQLLQMKDYRFSYKFKEACKADVLNHCKGIKSKGEVVSCLSGIVLNDTLRHQRPTIAEQCRNQLKVALMDRSENVQLDPELQKACDVDIHSLCKDIHFGNAKVLECLKEHKKELTSQCHVKIFNRQKAEAENPEMDYTFMRVCKRMIKQFCPESDPKDIFKCLKNHKSDPSMEQKCKQVITKRQITKNTDYRLKPALEKACNKDIPKFCQEEINSMRSGGNAVEYEGKIINCLKEKFRKNRLSQDCEGQIRIVMHEAAMDYRMDPVLKAACGDTIRQHCAEEIEQPGSGKVEDCLKSMLYKEKIEDTRCRNEVIRLLQEGKADIHVDPLLYKTCALDIKHFCVRIPPGEGRQMSCLLEALEDKSIRLNEDCRKMLTERVEMWEYAAKVAPIETLNDLAEQIQNSPSRNYYLLVLLCAVGILFMSGLFCGRATKRIRAELKNK
ncbi:Golgi apparatus protein 1-like isoform X2 [Ptychodera flava]|uniref:Golgi apparatus protein 1-like isoform X2 n=1 Tax=Ptychodera flava TaxID=63121 RepID=UPI00396A42A3